MPKGYFVIEVSVKDPERYQEYLSRAKGLFQAAGGKVLVGLNSRRASVEGDWSPERFLIIEFSSYEDAERWYYSDDYQAAVEHRHAAAVSPAMLFEEAPRA